MPIMRVAHIGLPMILATAVILKMLAVAILVSALKSMILCLPNKVHDFVKMVITQIKRQITQISVQ